ncbi:MAG: hypothetical protein KBD78_15410 [Oligoflexales bacterium]|nr:hypothetical protein [Oligoflexales bacterium]
MKTKIKFVIIATLAMFSALSCGSSETVSSKDIKPESIFEFYSLDFDANKNTANVTAQLRLGSFRGATVRLDQNENLTLDKQPFKKVDGDKVNAVADTASWLLFSPIFQLFKTGTFYYSSINSFSGNRHRIVFENAVYHIHVPSFNLSSTETRFAQDGVEATFKYKANSNSPADAQEKISCLFSIEDIEGTLLSVLSTEAIVVGDGKAKCSKLFIDETNATEIKSKAKRLVTEIKLQYEFPSQVSPRTATPNQVQIWTSNTREIISVVK